MLRRPIGKGRFVRPGVVALLLLLVALLGIPNAGTNPTTLTNAQDLAAYTSQVAAAKALTSTTGSGAVTKSKSVDRVFDDGGTMTTVDKRTVTLKVSQTKNLRSLQEINVGWSGAHVTDGTTLDENSDYAQNEEYSFDLFECRGVDSTSVPVAKRISPNTCWTEYGDERFQDGYSAEPAWQSDLYSTAAEREPIVDSPATSTFTPACTKLLYGTLTQRWVPFDATDGKTYYGGQAGCQGEAPEAVPQNLSSLSLPSNETYGVTQANGQGSAAFDIFTSEDHASLGCSSTVPCSLVAIPIEGLSCDPAGLKLPAAQRPDANDVQTAQTNCEQMGHFAPGEQLNGNGQSGNAAVDGSLWWSASNWRNRISVPLTFAPADNVCNVVNKQTPVSVYGSELMNQAIDRWSPHFCLDPKLFNLTEVTTPEPEAQRLLADNGVSAVFSSEPPATSTTPTVNAPVAVTGFAIGFTIDNDSKLPVVHLNLDARLLAKLLTESYPDQVELQDSYPLTSSGQATLSTNPLNITEDPEFIALNPDIPQKVEDAAATILQLNVQSDVTTALTSYINADPEARAWLNGTPDPWGMRVNPNYQGIKLPVNQWPLLDTYEPPALYQYISDPCLYLNPVPYLPLVADPQSSLYQIALDQEFSISQPETDCTLPSAVPGDTTGAKLVPLGRQAAGARFMLSVVSLGDAQRLGIPLANLESYTSPSATSEFTNATGRTFVAPSDATLDAAAKTMKIDSTSRTYQLNYNDLRSSKTADAYPGTMVVNANIPTTGLSTSLAGDYANLLDFAAGPGQHAGTNAGQLPGGYLPMTSANGLAGMVGYTQRSALVVAAQAGKLPSLTPVKTPAKKTPTPTPSGNNSDKGNSGGTPTSAPSTGTPTTPITGGGVSATTPAAATSTAIPSAPVVAPSPSAKPAPLGETADVTGGATSWALPAMLIVLLLAAGGAAAVQLRPRRK